MTKPICFSLNGRRVEISARADTTVLEYLRQDALLRGTKEGCAEGDCGACSVLVKPSNSEKFQPANSCIMLLGQLNGAALVTVEGLAAMGEEGHEVQACMAENGSSQCGFCTPGIVSALAGLLEHNDAPTHTQIHEGLAGNLCRCTGYRPIVEAAEKAAQALKKGKAKPLPEAELPASEQKVGNEASQLYQPRSLADLLTLLGNKEDTTLLAGGTDSALEVAHARARWPRIIHLAHVKEMQGVREEGGFLHIGGAASWSQTLPYLDNHWPSFARLIRRFGSVQIRTMGTVAGNIATASPIGDGAPSMLALDSVVDIEGSEGKRTVPLSVFFTAYRQTCLQPGEVIAAIRIPLPEPDLHFRVYKISKRYDQDISTTCGAFAFRQKDGMCSHVRIGFGGMAATPLRCEAAEQALEGKPLNDETVLAMQQAIANHFSPMSDMRGSAEYRTRVAQNLVARLAHELKGDVVEVMDL